MNITPKSLRQITGSTRSGQEFENRIEPSLDAYNEQGVAMLDWLPVPTAPAPGNPRMRIFKGKSPFDIYGYTMPDAKFIAAECKFNGDYSPSMPILASDGERGGGIEDHQLAALAGVAASGGIARIIWDNGGSVMVLTNEQIVFAYATYMTSKERGAKSIRKELFLPVEYSQIEGRGVPVLDWLKPERK